MYSRQAAYFSATPKGSTISRLDKLNGKADKSSFSNDVEYEEPEIKIENQEAQDIPFPELIEGSEYLVPLFHSAGTISQTGMGIAPLTWQEIRAWKELVVQDLSIWELETIKKMSDAYAIEHSLASDPKRPRPYTHVAVETQEIDREAVAQKTLDIFDSLMKKN